MAVDASDEEVFQASTFRARCRLPVVSWCHPRMWLMLFLLLLSSWYVTHLVFVAFVCHDLCFAIHYDL